MSEIVKETYAEKFLFKPGNVEEFVDRIEIVLSLSKEQILDIGLRLREDISKRFNNEVIKKQLLEVFSL